MAINSKIKGKTGELEFCKWLKENLSIKARRGQQFKGAPDSPDIITDLPIHWEIKRVEQLNIQKAMEQAINECGGDVPVVAHRKNRGDWLVTFRAEDIKGFAYAIAECPDFWL